MSYYLDKKARDLHKPYDYRQRKRDIHDAGIVSRKLSAWVRRHKAGRAR